MQNEKCRMKNDPKRVPRHRHFAFCIIHLSFCIIAFACCLPRPAIAQDKWLLTTAQFKTDSVFLKGLGAAGIKIAPAAGGADIDLPMDQLLDLTRSIPAAQSSGKFVLHMAGGDQIGGEPVSLKTESIVWKNAALGEISIPSTRIVAITQPGKAAPSDRSHEDVVRLSNGDTVHGIIASIGSDKITVQTSDGNSDVPLTAVASVSFAMTAGAGDTKHGFRIRMDDGSSLVGSDARLDGANLVLSLGKNADHPLALDHVTAIEQVNGPVSWLSTRTPAEAVYYRFIGGSQEPAAYMDRNWGGQHTIEFRGRSFPHGMGVHAFSRLSWMLDGSFKAFRTRFAVEGDSSIADARVRILLDDKVVYEQPHARSGSLSPVIIQDLGGAKKLTLEVDGGTAYSQDAVDWIEPALLREKPTEVPAPESDTTPASVAPSETPTTVPATEPTSK
jgi:hypothetical protein